MKIVFCTGSLETIPSNPQKSNLTLQFLRTARTPDKQKQTQGHKLYSKVLTIEPNRLLSKCSELNNGADCVFFPPSSYY
jgi:hypothetical protein